MAGKSVAGVGILLAIFLANAAVEGRVILGPGPRIITANVNVVLIDIVDGQQIAEVYGVIAARNGAATNEIALFQKTQAQHVTVKPGSSIPLSPSVVKPVFLNSNVTIRASLWDYNTFSGDDQIATGSAVFHTPSTGSEQQNITGAYGKISVTVTWQ